MFKWSVVVNVQNVSGGISATITQKDTKKEAEDFYYDTLSKTGGNPATKYLRVELKNEKGELQLASVRDNSEYVAQIGE